MDTILIIHKRQEKTTEGEQKQQDDEIEELKSDIFNEILNTADLKRTHLFVDERHHWTTLPRTFRSFFMKWFKEGPIVNNGPFSMTMLPSHHSVQGNLIIFITKHLSFFEQHRHLLKDLRRHARRLVVYLYTDVAAERISKLPWTKIKRVILLNDADASVQHVISENFNVGKSETFCTNVELKKEEDPFDAFIPLQTQQEEKQKKRQTKNASLHSPLSIADEEKKTTSEAPFACGSNSLNGDLWLLCFQFVIDDNTITDYLRLSRWFYDLFKKKAKQAFAHAAFEIDEECLKRAPKIYAHGIVRFLYCSSFEVHHLAHQLTCFLRPTKEKETREKQQEKEKEEEEEEQGEQVQIQNAEKSTCLYEQFVHLHAVDFSYFLLDLLQLDALCAYIGSSQNRIQTLNLRYSIVGDFYPSKQKIERSSSLPSFQAMLPHLSSFFDTQDTCNLIHPLFILLKENATLKRLILAHNRLLPMDVCLLIAALKTNTHLEHLDLSFNAMMHPNKNQLFAGLETSDSAFRTINMTGTLVSDSVLPKQNNVAAGFRSIV